MIRANSSYTKQGFWFEIGRKGYFYEIDQHNITDKIVRKFINAVCDERGTGDSIRRKALYDKPTLEDFKRRIGRATLQYKDTDFVEYYTVSGNGFTLNFPCEDFENEVILIH